MRFFLLALAIGCSGTKSTTIVESDADTDSDTDTDTDADTDADSDADTDPEPVCGDGVVDGDEVCDDGVNDGSYGGCSSDCLTAGPACGDGEVTDVEVCDDGVNDGSYGGCSSDCLALGPACGDGEVTDAEVCDDGVNDGAYDGCATDCLAWGPQCGDGVVSNSEVCDDGLNDGSYGSCLPDCSARAAHCGDSEITDGEMCDDGVNDGAYNGCTPDCIALAPYCGDGIQDFGEACDDGVNDGAYNGCATDCRTVPSFCGDGIFQADLEACDDGENDGSYNGCNPDCQSLGGFCGDGNVDPEELCDDGVNDELNGGCQPGCDEEDLSHLGFDPNRFLTVELTMDPDDFEELRTQNRSRHTMYGHPECLDQPFPSPFTYFPADVTIDGETVGTVGVRKKGFLGSMSIAKPSLRIDFAEYDDDLRWETQRRMVLNNDIKDPSHLHQCMAYKAFTDAGLPAPRCNFARVWVNGEDFGIFTHPEVVKKQFLRNALGNDDGNLYEGTLSDFRPEFMGTFEQDLANEGDDSKSDLLAVLAAMDLPDDQLLAALEPLIDMPELYRYWAMETLVWHHDGWSGNTNNFYIYGDPARDNKLIWIPWGPDHAFHEDTRDIAKSVMTRPILLQRLYTIDESRNAYFAALDDLLANHWDVDGMIESIDDFEVQLIAQMPVEEVADFMVEVQIVRDFVINRQAVMDADRLDGTPEPSLDLRGSVCLEIVGDAHITVSDSMWSIDELGPWEDCPNEVFDVVVDGSPLVYERLRCRSGIHNANNRHYFQMLVDTPTQLRYTFSLLFPVDAPNYLGPGLWPELSNPWGMSLVERDLDLGVNTHIWEVALGPLDIQEYPMVDDAPARMEIRGTVFQR